MNAGLTRLEDAQRALNLTNREMAAELRVSEFWYSKVINGHRQPSDDLLLRLEDMLRRRNLAPRTNNLNSGEIPHTKFTRRNEVEGTVAPRHPPKRTPSTRADCEEYFHQLLDTAESCGDPNAWPVILHRLKQQFPVGEWQAENPDETPQ